ncbi:helix-turn-helix transcriptional regulator [Actinokineospora sp. G85]|uniref:helix-turn-helix transcriptional regulator n=1 Tax=Actinokineospora sp. G85 TaxID=3406626 RepID=UPI003C7637FB
MADWSLVAARRDVERAPAERVFGLPHPALAGQVLSYTAHDFPAMERMSWRWAPLGAVTVVLDITAPTRWGMPASPVLGLRDRPAEVEQAGASRGITIALSPAGAHALLGLPLREVANTAIGLVDLLGRDAARLLERVAEAGGWPERFHVLDAFLAPRLRAGPALALPVRGAWQRLTESAGRLRISDLADEVGWTRQHLSARFRAQIGLPPKSVARIVRLHHATTLLSHLPLAEVAHRCGYADQAHLNRDFRALTGASPTERHQ